MILAIIILVIVSIITWLLAHYQEKYKIILKTINFLSIASLILTIITFFTNYDPLNTIKEYAENLLNKQKSVAETPKPLEVHITESSNAQKKETKKMIH